MKRRHFMKTGTKKLEARTRVKQTLCRIRQKIAGRQQVTPNQANTFTFFLHYTRSITCSITWSESRTIPSYVMKVRIRRHHGFRSLIDKASWENTDERTVGRGVQSITKHVSNIPWSRTEIKVHHAQMCRSLDVCAGRFENLVLAILRNMWWTAA